MLEVELCDIQPDRSKRPRSLRSLDRMQRLRELEVIDPSFWFRDYGKLEIEAPSLLESRSAQYYVS
jgi:hypothetical protein